jgi:hypothetical protein
METGLKLAGVEMAPRPLLGVIKRGQLDAALGARPPRWIVLQPQVDALVVGLQFHTRDVPWRGDPQNRFEQIRVLQPLLPEPLYQPDTSTFNPPPSRPPTQVQGPRRRPHKSPGSLATHEDSGRAIGLSAYLSKPRMYGMFGGRSPFSNIGPRVVWYFMFMNGVSMRRPAAE